MASSDNRIEIVERFLEDLKQGNIPELPEISSRLKIITTLFTTKMEQVGITPYEDSGYTPTSQTPLVRYLRQYVSDEVVDMIISSNPSESEMRDILEMITDKPHYPVEPLSKWNDLFQPLVTWIKQARNYAYPEEIVKPIIMTTCLELLARYFFERGLTTDEINSILLGLVDGVPEASQELVRLFEKGGVDMIAIRRILQYLFGIILD